MVNLNVDFVTYHEMQLTKSQSCILVRRLVCYLLVISWNFSCRFYFCNIPVAFADICRQLEWKNFEVVVSSSKLINVRNVMNDAKEKLDFRDRVIKTSVSFKYMIVATSSQCYIYR